MGIDDESIRRVVIHAVGVIVGVAAVAFAVGLMIGAS